ncbi:MAG TPA: lytic murein transglycosylase [Xanthobacteraceae bacterium]|jgi:lytic murein transglycosylase|nr:lytic murein transglycosylase [Xanthobacteraceae bacterium]
MNLHIRLGGFRPISPKLAVAARLLSSFTLVSALLLAGPHPSFAADAAFTQWLASLWPQAQAMGVSRATFEAATRGVEPDFSLPDLAVPGRPEAPQPGQPEFVRTPADYLRETTISRLAARGAKLREQYRPVLDRIEQRFGVPGAVVLAIWGRESDFSMHSSGQNVIQVLATQAYVGKRKDMFRQELLLALKMWEDGVPPADLRSSWGGAMGLTQFLPSEFYKYAVDFDGDGRRDIWHSVPDALASAAKQLAAKGWQRKEHWAYEVHAPDSFDCTQGVPEVARPIGDWLKAGFVPAYGRRLRPDELAESASVLQPEGIYGPAFLTTKNYFVIKDYNFSDLYALFVGHVSDRISDPRPFETPWSKGAQMRTADVEAMQKDLTARGLYQDKIDGKAGMLTRAALGAYQKASGLKLDCWPTSAVLAHMRAHPAAAAAR